jgi:hypothetical protein
MSSETAVGANAAANVQQDGLVGYSAYQAEGYLPASLPPTAALDAQDCLAIRLFR